MLVLTRKLGENIRIGDSVKITVLEVRSGQVKLGIEAPPEDASWGERYFHVTDPDGHELSFAKRLA